MKQYFSAKLEGPADEFTLHRRLYNDSESTRINFCHFAT